jgi:lipid-binding SYLF domain-containing protein
MKEEKGMKTKVVCQLMASAIVVLFAGFLACSTAPLSKAQIDEQRTSIREMASQTLAQLYKQYPDSPFNVETAAGYAVFSDFGMKFMFLGGAGGQGVAVNNVTKQQTFMKMVELQPGFGFGAQKFRIVFIFQTPEAFNQFVNSGWEFGANAMAAAKTSTQGAGAQMGATVAPGVTMFQLSEQGAIVGVSITGAKYYKNDQLN